MAQTATRKRTTKKKIDETLNANNSLFIVDNNGIIACKKTKNKLTVAGVIEPDDFAQFFSKPQPIETPILPTNTIYYSRTEKVKSIAHNIILAYKPQWYNLKVKSKLYRIYLPYLVANIHINEMSNKYTVLNATLLGCLEEPNYNTQLYNLPITNLYSDGRVCFGSTNAKHTIEDSFVAVVNGTLNAYFDGNGNEDLGLHLSKELRTIYDSFDYNSRYKLFYEFLQQKCQDSPHYLLDSTKLSKPSKDTLKCLMKPF